MTYGNIKLQILANVIAYLYYAVSDFILTLQFLVT